MTKIIKNRRGKGRPSVLHKLIQQYCHFLLYYPFPVSLCFHVAVPTLVACGGSRICRHISVLLLQLPDELSPPILSEVDGTIDGIGSLSKSSLKFNFKVQAERSLISKSLYLGAKCERNKKAP